MGLIFIMALIIFAWILTGGYNREISFRGPYLKPITNIGEEGEAFGNQINIGGITVGPRGERVPSSGSLEEIRERIESYRETVEGSSYHNQVFIENTSGAREADPSREYITIRASRNNKEGVNITGWRLTSGVTGGSYEIGSGSYLPFLGKTTSESAIYLAPGEGAIVTTGRSPIGVSFRINLCTGYLSQFQNYTPSLPISCPAGRDSDLPINTQIFNDECRDFVNQLSRCQVITQFPDTLKYECRDFVSRTYTYNNCVDTYKDRSNFYGGEWRIFLKRDSEIWKSRYETIKLLDQSGKTVDQLSF